MMNDLRLAGFGEQTSNWNSFSGPVAAHLQRVEAEFLLVAFVVLDDEFPAIRFLRPVPGVDH